MVLLPRKGLLAIAAVVDVAPQTTGRPISGKTLAARQGLPPRRKHDFGDNLGLQLFLFLVADAGSAQNIIHRHAVPFARKLVSAVRAADALEEAVAHERL
jgi:hypothetical protein